ncbi:uncharacterized protein LOC131158717 [Malania oleifera]|uniref:uncharacterized protein LOC131158717 n=1 Tax=Malania oleifera TaxID=397392 RepID=UPI0025AE3971|nr:uncharacterized protein LOC131158717 [Malania oleifera]
MREQSTQGLVVVVDGGGERKGIPGIPGMFVGKVGIGIDGMVVGMVGSEGRGGRVTLGSTVGMDGSGRDGTWVLGNGGNVGFGRVGVVVGSVGTVGLGRVGIVDSAGGGAAGVSNRRRAPKLVWMLMSDRAATRDRAKQRLEAAMGV